jgi:hypothetical protein
VPASRPLPTPELVRVRKSVVPRVLELYELTGPVKPECFSAVVHQALEAGLDLLLARARAAASATAQGE